MRVVQCRVMSSDRRHMQHSEPVEHTNYNWMDDLNYTSSTTAVSVTMCICVYLGMYFHRDTLSNKMNNTTFPTPYRTKSDFGERLLTTIEVC
jgi:hypothetical protein